ncbi:GNAT family N-acetyltransferase [Pseudoalteromonas sp. SSDWG2]|uniref:GNAT family N-acetyltransferase n=1 Tax=Pseudoalteromonas sp. SSDWG2 TaxID=3139391 RepID=UPI003BAC4470
MRNKIVADNSTQLSEWLKEQVVAFNQSQWPVQRQELGFSINNEDAQRIGGISGRWFGNWLLIDWLWVNPEDRGQGYASELLSKLESHAKELGANKAVLDTLEFQAPEFYRRHGYEEVFVLENYPLTGRRSYMCKEL